jgi:hypothetical protein
MMDRQASGDRLKPWPDEFEAEYMTLVRSSRRLALVGQVTLEHGVGKHRNIALIEQLLPVMVEESRLILAAFQRMLRAKTGRWPNWVLAAAENGILLAHEAARTAEAAEAAFRRGRWTTMVESISACATIAVAVEIYVTKGPMPESIDPIAIIERIVEESSRG